MTRVPVVVLTGHLGSGKTTLLNFLLRRPGARVGSSSTTSARSTSTRDSSELVAIGLHLDTAGVQKQLEQVLVPTGNP